MSDWLAGLTGTPEKTADDRPPPVADQSRSDGDQSAEQEPGYVFVDLCLSQAAPTAGDTRSACRALRALAWSLDDDDPAERVALLEEALALARADGGAAHVSNHLAWLADAVADTGDHERVRALAEEAEELAREAGDSWKRLIPTIGLGWLAVADKRLDDATRYFQMAVDLGTEFGYYAVLGVFGLGQMSVRRNDLDQARQQYRQALIDLREMAPGSFYLAEGLLYAASLEFDVGRYERAQRLMGAYQCVPILAYRRPERTGHVGPADVERIATQPGTGPARA